MRNFFKTASRGSDSPASTSRASPSRCKPHKS